MAHIPYQFCMKLCEIFLQRISQNIGYERTWFSNNLVLSVVKYPTFCLNELSYIFHTFENIKFPTFSWLFDSFPNPSWLCQPIPYLFKALNKSDSWLFQDFPYPWEPCVNDFCGYSVNQWVLCITYWFLSWRKWMITNRKPSGASGWFKASFSFYKLIPKNTQMTTLYTNLSLYITFTMIYYIRQEYFCKSFTSQSYIRRKSGLFIANAM